MNEERIPCSVRIRINYHLLSFGEVFINKEGLLEHPTFSALGKFQEKLPAKWFNLYMMTFSNSFAGAMYLFLCLLKCRFMLSEIAETA